MPAAIKFTMCAIMLLNLSACEKGCDARFKQDATKTQEPHDASYYENLLKKDWELLKTKVKEQWEHLSDLDLAQIQGDWHKLSDFIQQKYHKSKDEADKWIREFLHRNDLN